MASCILCGKSHGAMPSVRNLWHQCTNCGAIFCDDCGRERLPRKRGLMDGTRDCTECGGRTQLVSMPQQTYRRTSEVSSSNYASQEISFQTWVTVFLQMTFFVIFICGLASYGLIGLFTGFKLENLNWKAILILGCILFLPSWYFGIRWFRRRRKKVKQSQT